MSSVLLASLTLTACAGSKAAPVETTSKVSIESADDTTSSASADEASSSEAATLANEPAATTIEPVPATTEPPAKGALNINTDGPAVCITAALAVLGPDAMVNEIASSFETGDDIEPPAIADDEPPVPGNLVRCEAFYQDPANPIKLLAITMDTETGEFGEPEQVEITVGGDASDFDLNDYVMKASDVNISVIQPLMDEKAPALNEVYSLWRWDGVTLTAPGPFNDVHVFDLRMTGRLAKNDITESGYITVAMDGSVVGDHLTN